MIDIYIDYHISQPNCSKFSTFYKNKMVRQSVLSLAWSLSGSDLTNIASSTFALILLYGTVLYLLYCTVLYFCPDCLSEQSLQTAMYTFLYCTTQIEAKYYTTLQLVQAYLWKT